MRSLSSSYCVFFVYEGNHIMKFLAQKFKKGMFSVTKSHVAYVVNETHRTYHVNHK